MIWHTKSHIQSEGRVTPPPGCELLHFYLRKNCHYIFWKIAPGAKVKKNPTAIFTQMFGGDNFHTIFSESGRKWRAVWIQARMYVFVVWVCWEVELSVQIWSYPTTDLPRGTMVVWKLPPRKTIKKPQQQFTQILKRHFFVLNTVI